MNRVVLVLGSSVSLKPDRKTNVDLAAEACLRYAEQAAVALPEALPERIEVAEHAVDSAHLSGDEIADLLTPLTADLILSEGHLRLSRLVKERYFSTIFTMGFDNLLEQALEQEHLMPGEQYNLVVVGKATRTEITGALVESNRFTVVKLLGDAGVGAAITAAQVASHLKRAAHVVHELSRQTVIVVGYGDRDRGLLSTFSHDAAPLWWVNPRYPIADRDAYDNLRIEEPEQLQHHAFMPAVVQFLVDRKTERQVISRDTGTFDGFFAALYDRRVRRGSDTHIEPRKQLLHVEPEGPFKFLDHYETRDASIFFGRERETADVSDLIDAHRVAVIFGRSGTGKTSLINAGLIPRLEDEGAIAVATRVLDDPRGRLLGELARHAPIEEPAHIRQRRGSMHEALKAITEETGRQVVVFLDQFEEFFTRLGDRVRQTFVEGMAECTSDGSLNVRWVIGIREDFFHELYELKEQIPSILHAVYRLKRFAPAQARQAIVKPTAKFEMKFEDLLTDQILEDLDSDEGIRPADLQIICYRLVERLGPRRRHANLQDYEALNGAQGILKGHIGYVLQQLPWRDRETARTVLKELVRSMRMKAPLAMEKICSDLRIERARIEKLLWQLTDYRLVRRIGDEADRRYELVHEYLVDEIEGWMSEAEIEAKDAQDLLARELNNWIEFQVAIPREALKAIHESREALSPTPDELELLLVSCAEHEFELDHWFPKTRELGDQEVAFLRRMLRHDSEPVRERAVERLDTLGSAAALEALLDALPECEGGDSQRITSALEKRGRELVRALSVGDTAARVRSAYALGQIGTDAAAIALIDVLTRPNEPMPVYHAVVSALRSIGPKAALRGLEAVVDAVSRPARRAGGLPDWSFVETGNVLAGLALGDECIRRLADAVAPDASPTALRYALTKALWDQRRLQPARDEIVPLLEADLAVEEREAVDELARAVDRLEDELQSGYYSWPMFRKTPDHAGCSPETLRYPLKQVWSHRADGQIVSSPCVQDGMVFTGSRDGVFRALGLKSGEVAWQVSMGERVEATAAVWDGRVYCGSKSGVIHCLDAGSGERIWRFATEGEIRAAPTLAHGRVYIGSWDRRFYCLDAITGALVFKTELGGEILASAAVADKVYIGCWDGSLYALDADDGTRAFAVPSEAEIHASAACDDGRVVFGSDDGHLYCIDSDSGKVQWRASLGGQVRSSAAIGGGTVYVGSGDGLLRGLRLDTGEATLEFRTGEAVTSSPAITPDSVVFGSRDGGLYAVSRATGELLWSELTSYAVTCSPAIADGLLVTFMDYYRVAAFGPAGA